MNATGLSNLPNMRRQPKVSLLIATYNEEEHIKDCVESFLNQDYKNVEVLVTDDGSADKTVEIVKSLAKKDKRVRLFKQSHKGMAFAWNNSASKSSGDIVITIGADTIAEEKSFIRKMIEPIIKEKAYGTCHEREVNIHVNNLWVRAKSCTSERDEKGRPYGIHPAEVYTAIRKDVWDMIGGADVKRGYDADQTFIEKIGVMPVRAHTTLLHDHPSSFHDTWKQAVWVGASMSRNNHLKLFLGSPAVPFIVLFRSIKNIRKSPDKSLIFFLPFYYGLAFAGYYVGTLTYLLTGERKR